MLTTFLCTVERFWIYEKRVHNQLKTYNLLFIFNKDKEASAN